jgi:hypothetical protein
MPPGAGIADTNLVVLICLFLFEGVRLWAAFNFIPKAEGSPPSVPTILLRQYANFAPAIMLSGGAVLIILFGFLQPFVELRAGTATWLVLIMPVLRATLLWCTVAAIILYRQHRLGIALLLLVMIPAILFNLPTSVPESLSLTILLAWALASGFFVTRRTHLFSWMLIGYFVLAAPAIESARVRISPTESIHWKSAWKEQFVGAQCWRSLSLSIDHYKNQPGITGRQLMGTALFFVPRSVWPNKPDGSELMLQKTYPSEGIKGCTILAEGFLNFGIWGSSVFAVLIALGIAAYDGWYWRRGGHLRFTLPRLFYFPAFGLLFCLMLGDLQYAFLNGAVFLIGFTFWQGIFFWRITGPKYQLHY